jgi:hypothetical protein
MDVARSGALGEEDVPDFTAITRYRYAVEAAAVESENDVVTEEPTTM